MNNYVCFGDDSGVNIECQCFAVALVCFRRTRGQPLLKHGYALLSRVKRILRWESGELKYRSVERRASRLGYSLSDILHIVIDGSDHAASVRLHSTGSPLEERVEAVRRLLLLTGVGNPLLVLDHGLIPGSESRASRLLGVRVRFASSRTTPGIQLSDILAGACYHGLRCTLDECG